MRSDFAAKNSWPNSAQDLKWRPTTTEIALSAEEAQNKFDYRLTHSIDYC